MKGSQATVGRRQLNSRGTGQNKKGSACPHGLHRPIQDERNSPFKNNSF